MSDPLHALLPLFRGNSPMLLATEDGLFTAIPFNGYAAKEPAFIIEPNKYELGHVMPRLIFDRAKRGKALSVRQYEEQNRIEKKQKKQVRKKNKASKQSRKRNR